MNLLENQVSDLSYLADLTTLPLPLESVAQLGNMEMNGRQSTSSNTAESPASNNNNNNNNGKRKADEGGAPTGTRKRNRYITQAWYGLSIQTNAISAKLTDE